MIASLWSDPVQIMLLVTFAGASVVYALVYMHTPIGRLRTLFKTLPIVMLAVLSFWMGGSTLLMSALILSAIGDYFLSLDKRFFIPGLVSFLLGHLAYIVLLAGLVSGPATLVGLGVVIIYSLGFASFLWGRTGKYRLAVMVYIGVITAMAALSLQLPETLRLVTYGAFIFVLSDTVLALRMFVFGEDHRSANTLSQIVWATYIPAQLAIVIGVTSL